MRDRWFVIRVLTVISVVLALLGGWSARSATVEAQNQFFQLQGVLAPGEQISPVYYIPTPTRAFNYKLEVTGVAGDGPITLTVFNGATHILDGVGFAGEITWGTGTLTQGINTLQLRNDDAAPLNFKLALYDLPTPSYSWEGTALPAGQDAQARMVFPQSGLYTFDFGVSAGGSYQFSLDTDYIKKQIESPGAFTFFVAAGVHTLEIAQDTAVTWSVAVSAAGPAFDTLPYGKTGENVQADVLPLSLQNAAQVNLVLTATGVNPTDKLVFEVFGPGLAPIPGTATTVYAGETTWTSFNLPAGVSSIQITADGGNAGALDYALVVDVLPAPPYAWEGNAVAAGDHSYARVTFPTAGRYRFDFTLAGGRFQFLVNEDFIQKTVEGAGSVTYYIPAGTHDLVIVQDPTLGAEDWGVAISLVQAGAETLPYAKSGGELGGAGNAFFEEWLPIGLAAGQTANLQIEVSGQPTDQLIIEVYRQGSATPDKVINAVLGSEVLWANFPLSAGINRLHLIAPGSNADPLTYDLTLNAVPTDAYTWEGHALAGGLPSEIKVHFANTGLYRFSIASPDGFANLLLDDAIPGRSVQVGGVETVYDIQVTAGVHTLYVMQDSAFPQTTWTAQVLPVAAQPAFFTFEGEIEEGVTVAPYYPVFGAPLDFNFALAVAGDDVTLTIQDVYANILWEGTALAGETLWGTATLPVGNNRFVLTNGVGGSGDPAQVALTLYSLSQAPYTWMGVADADGLHSEARVIFPTSGLYTFNFNVTGGGRYQFQVADDFILKTVEGIDSVTYYVPAGTHPLTLIQDSAVGAEWAVAISGVGAQYNALPYLRSGGELGGAGNDFVEEWLPLNLQTAQSLNLATTLTGVDGDSLVLKVYDAADTLVKTAHIYANETHWSTFDLPAGMARLHLEADAGNGAPLEYSLALRVLPQPPTTWSGSAYTEGENSHARVTFSQSGLYTFNFQATGGRFQFLVNENYIQKTVESGTTQVTLYIPAGTHDLRVVQDTATGADWSVGISAVGAATNVLPYMQTGGDLGGAGNDFDAEWLPVFFGAPQRVNLELVVAGDYPDALQVEIVSGLTGETRLLTLEDVYGGETLWATVDMGAANRLRIVAEGGNAGPLTYTATLHAIPEPPYSWGGVIHGDGNISAVRLDTPVSGLYLVEVNLPQGFAVVYFNAVPIRSQPAPQGFTYDFEIPLSAGTHTVYVVQQPDYAVTEWEVAISLLEADAPAISAIAPTLMYNHVANTLTVTGANFLPGAVVKVGTQSLTTTYISATQLQATVLAGLAVGVYDVSVTNPDDKAAVLPNSLHIENPPPTITAVTPTVIYNDTANTLTVTGANFLNGAVVKVGTQTLTTTYISATQLQATVPAGFTVGLYDVTVRNPDGKEAVLADVLHVEPPADFIVYLPLVSKGTAP